MLEAVAFLCGAAVMALEMTGSRILAPHLGSSVLVWTALIGVIMAFLSSGYWLGGKLADKDPGSKRLALIIAGGAFCVLATAFFQNGVLASVGGMRLPREYAAMLAATLLFGPASLLLGMVSPYVVRVALQAREVPVEKSGAVIGRFSAASAIGSILGTFAGGYYMISYLGSRQSLYFLASMLMGVALVALASDKITLRRERLRIALLPLAGLGLAAFFWHGQYRLEAAELARGNFGVDTRYSRLEINEGYNAEGYHMRLLSTPPDLTQSAINLERPNELVLAYTRAFALAWQIRPQAGRFLMLGGAGYSVPRYLLNTRPEISLDVVEIDPGMTDLARRYFLLADDPRLRIFHEDARSYLNRYAARTDRQGYDIVMGDTFSSVYNIPFQMSTVECMRRVHDALADDGVYIVNLLSAVTGPKSKLFNAVRGSLAEVFDEVRVFPLSVHSPDTVQNIMLLALKKTGAVPTVAEFKAAGLNPALPSHAAADEFAQTLHLLENEWRVTLLGEVPPLYDDFAPVELYALPMTR